MTGSLVLVIWSQVLGFLRAAALLRVPICAPHAQADQPLSGDASGLMGVNVVAGLLGGRPCFDVLPFPFLPSA